MPKYAYKKRTFLNEDPTMSAFVIASIEKYTVSKESGKVYSYPMLDLADCSNKVSIDFCFYDEAGMERSLRKARKLQKVVNDFVEAMESEKDEYYKNKSKNPVKKNSKKK